MKTVNVTLRIDEDLKESAEALFEDIGLSLNAACRIFLKKAVQEQRIPFELTRPDRKTRKAISDAERDQHVSGGYDSVDELIEALDE
jgi:DNA-damage-inducible protein J